MFKHILITLSFLSATCSGNAQTFTISGTVKDGTNGEDAPFVSIRVKELSGTGTNSNVYGFYSLSLPKGAYTLIYSYSGFEPLEKQVELDQNIVLNVELSASSQLIDEVTVSAKKEDESLTKTDGSTTEIDMKALKEIPAFGGEPDIVRIAQMNPGIKTAGEGNSGFYVRGGGLDQNLVLLDEAPVYNPSHMLGIFSVFNGDAIKGATIYKGGMAAEYGGRTASVMDIRMKEGNSKKLNVSGGLGLIASRLTIEAPIVKDKGSFMISGRRSYADLYLKLSKDESLNQSKLYFYDLNLKANYRITEKDKLYISGFFGRDEFGFSDVFGMNWGNATGTMRWNHIINEKFFSNTLFIYSNYDFRFLFGTGEDQVTIRSRMNDFQLKQDFTYFASSKHQLKFGFNAIHHNLEPGSIEAGNNVQIEDSKAELNYGIEGALYLQNEHVVSDRIRLNYGLRFSFFDRLGSGTAYEFDDQGNVVSTASYADWQSMKWYIGLEPRLSSSFMLNSKSSLKLNYNRNFQYMHLISNSTSALPSDVWIMSSNNVKPQIADQVSLGYFRNFKENMFEASAEVYYKYMQNTIDYRDGADIFLNDALEGELVFGVGESYGLELFLKKNSGRLTGWIGYTLSKTTRQYDEINQGDKFSARQDRTHDINLVLMFKINDRWSVSGNYIYYTGDAVTFPTGKYTYNDMTVPLYSTRNGQRMPDYHRLDLGITWHNRDTEKFESSWNFSLYNTYGRENAYSISVQESEDNPQQLEAVQTSLFRWIPSITYNFKFK